MFVIAITEVASDLESEAYALAPLLGLSTYDVRTRITGVLPRIVYQSLDRDEALRALASIRARGNGAVACDTSALARADTLVRVKRFAIDDGAFYANGPSGPRLPWAELSIVVTVAARTDITRTTIERDAGSHGLNHQGQTYEHEYTSHERMMDRSAFMFSHAHEDGTMARPWLLHEREAQFLALGPRMQPTRHQNFDATIALLRDHAREALFDDRFVRDPLTSTEFISVVGNGPVTVSTAPRGVEVIVNLLAQWLERGRGGPYRG